MGHAKPHVLQTARGAVKIFFRNTVSCKKRNKNGYETTADNKNYHALCHTMVLTLLRCMGLYGGEDPEAGQEPVKEKGSLYCGCT